MLDLKILSMSFTFAGQNYKSTLTVTGKTFETILQTFLIKYLSRL